MKKLKPRYESRAVARDFDFIATFQKFDFQYSFPKHTLKHLEHITNKKWTLSEALKEYNQHKNYYIQLAK